MVIHQPRGEIWQWSVCVFFKHILRIDILNTGLGNDLVPSDNKPLPQPVLTQEGQAYTVSSKSICNVRDNIFKYIVLKENMGNNIGCNYSHKPWIEVTIVELMAGMSSSTEISHVITYPCPNPNLCQ